MHEVKVAIVYTLLVNRSDSVIDCRKGHLNSLRSEVHLKLNEVLTVPTRTRDETLDYRVLRVNDSFDRDHALRIHSKEFECSQIIYIREDVDRKLFLDWIPRDHSLLVNIAFKADIQISEKHLLRNKKKIKNHTNTTLRLSETVRQPGLHIGVFTELVSIKPGEVVPLRYYDDKERMANTRYRIVSTKTPGVFKEWTGIDFFKGKEYISIFDPSFQIGQGPPTIPNTIEIQSWPRTYKRIMKAVISKF